ncbi:MAG: cytochrome c nitrite reductase small subunit [Desulfobacteraceae bacterium]|nr:cytochrome c nitrite reductase small subunit [Desulfobacteraceae bacterium]
MRFALPPKKRKYPKLLVLLALAGIAVGGFVSFGPPGLYAKSGTPEFCASCHVMEAQYENWFHNGGHRRQKCIDCHLPNDNKIRHLTWKGYEGMWDAYVFYSGKVPETIRITGKGAAIVKENCLRCHEQTVMNINTDRDCWQCHRRLSHRLTGSL